MHGGYSWGLRKHRQGGHGKHAQPPSRWAKHRRALDANATADDRARFRAGRRRLQELMPITDWLRRNTR